MNFGLKESVAGIITMLSLFTAVIYGIPQPGKAAAALRSAGMEPKSLNWASMFRCAEDDLTRHEFHAVDAEGKPVSGYICCGLLKGCTVRF